MKVMMLCFRAANRSRGGGGGGGEGDEFLPSEAGRQLYNNADVAQRIADFL